MQYSKPAISIADQIQLLESRGLIISDRSEAEHFLTQISYYRLAGYWWPLQVDRVNHIFQTGIEFQTIIQRYNFDRELRLIVFNMIERIEVGLRTQMIYQLSCAYGPWWFEDEQYFKDRTLWGKNLEEIKSELNRSKEVFITEHKKKYQNDLRCPPAWKSLEIVSFGLLSKLYNSLSDNLTEKEKIARDLYIVKPKFLSSWWRAISVVRNICAHHSRLWDRNLPNPPRFLSKLPNQWIDTTNVDSLSIYYTICCMQYLLQSISPKNRFRERFETLFADYPNINIQTMGFPPNWQHQALWQ
jgi:abortive infection bacteriophage resistance protein